MTRTAILASLLLAAAAPVAAADRNYSVTNFDRIRLDGPYRVRLTTGVAPFARASGSAAALSSVAIDVQGRTLVVRPSRSSWGGYPGEAQGSVEISVGTHELGAAWVNGAGSLHISEVEGLKFDLSVHGPGSAQIEKTEVDQLKIAISGAASSKLSGTAKKLTALVQGTSVLDGSALKVTNATVGAEGPTQVSLAVTGEAEVDARGVASVALTGGPACNVRTHGSASVTGCETSGRR